MSVPKHAYCATIHREGEIRLREGNRQKVLHMSLLGEDFLEEVLGPWVCTG